MKQMTLEKEFNAYRVRHMISVLSAYMINQANKGEVNIPTFVNESLKEDIQETVKSSMKDGTFKEKYEVAWNSIKDLLP